VLRLALVLAGVGAGGAAGPGGFVGGGTGVTVGRAVADGAVVDGVVAVGLTTRFSLESEPERTNAMIMAITTPMPTAKIVRRRERFTWDSFGIKGFGGSGGFGFYGASRCVLGVLGELLSLARRIHMLSWVR